ncbi:Inner membrane transport permease YbhR [Lacunisphaera limnophila]|uniref:Inner membrane transport permease YbhR n=1 Tax=Lacunisphaera limnophila TaxID=1838286 RepID=A0A1D8AU88_9BACT|nr:ABC transporter permease [Lacunisphaera limnophila]AOS44448.1 Inner membrane transport permease YbhR [Lacunisphaera limnophila]
MSRFTFHRLWAIVLKEFIQMKRDRVTFGMMVGIPLMQLIVFGFAINSDPKHLPAALRAADQGPYARTLVAALKNSGYFTLVREAATEAEAHQMLQLGEVQFVINIPEDFTRTLLRGERPTVLIEADATDPAAVGPAVSATRALADSVFNRDLTGPLARLRGTPGPVAFQVHAHYNPENITQYNIVPGLMGVVLTMTMVVITALAITRERERGTMENLLATPVRPFEVMLGKILPYIVVGYIQVTLILLAARFVFHVPMTGSLPLLYLVAFFFIAANLAMGITFSTLAKNQLQAVQMAFFFFLPSILLSGFMFPFRGMPEWAQWIGSCLPNTHFLRIARGILLKGNGVDEILPHLWPLLLFLTVAMTIGVKRYRQTLD